MWDRGLSKAMMNVNLCHNWGIRLVSLDCGGSKHSGCCLVSVSVVFLQFWVGEEGLCLVLVVGRFGWFS